MSAVTRVELSFNGTLFATDTTSPFSFAWDTANVADGTYTLTVEACDAAGNTAQSGVTAKLSTRPTFCRRSSPSPYRPMEKIPVTPVTVYISANDNVGVTKTELYIDGY